jgi:hypothetical protein
MRLVHLVAAAAAAAAAAAVVAVAAAATTKAEGVAATALEAAGAEPRGARQLPAAAWFAQAQTQQQQRKPDWRV